ncbi:MAG: hypothetical protein JWN01_213 [Patescibacteria group bacterium]|jgi:cyanate permease|nr:hypothetical protein [Patescibacteria group bacterium]
MTFILDKLLGKSLTRQTRPHVHRMYFIMLVLSPVWIALRFVWYMPSEIFVLGQALLMGVALGSAITLIVLSKSANSEAKRIGGTMIGIGFLIPLTITLVVDIHNLVH